ncbi:MAG: tRNA (N(6)-L-threonylcarbamoyladenosine(37)-C(2))-methylthiotransferase MtaB [Synergistaceae bacterium]
MTYLIEGKKFKIITQGCRTNQYEGEAIVAQLENKGAIYDELNPEIVIIVTCTITSVADRKCRKLIRRLRRENEKALIIAVGCYAQKMTNEEREELGLDIIVGNRLKYRISDLIEEYYEEDGEPLIETLPDYLMPKIKSWDKLTLDRPRLHTRAFLKVQDGCNHFCSYCIVPYVRGNPVSRDIGEAIDEAKKIVSSGCPELILTGVHLGLYDKLPELIEKVSKIDGLKRLRFGSIEPFAVDETLLKVLADSEVFCKHLHMPLQNGDDEILKTMKRGYTSAQYAKIVENVRKHLGEQTHISTDLMIGFAGEDDNSFTNSMNFIKEMKFGKIHVFPYSPREGTEASHFELPKESIVTERVKEALQTAEELHKTYCTSWIGKKNEILVEENENGIIKGLTPEYVRVMAKVSNAEISSTQKVIPEKYHDGILLQGEFTEIGEKDKDFSQIL